MNEELCEIFDNLSNKCDELIIKYRNGEKLNYLELEYLIHYQKLIKKILDKKV